MMMMMMMNGLVVGLSFLVVGARAAARSCPANSPLSCHNTTAVVDTCCFLPSGQLLQTQFWDTQPATGPSDSWTIHGLWPDNCDGSFPTSCDSGRRAYKNLSSILPDDLVSQMRVFWKDGRGNDEQFWEHEWAKHGTCITTLEPECFASGASSEFSLRASSASSRTVSPSSQTSSPSSSTPQGFTPGDDATAFFSRTLSLFQSLPTYKWLSDARVTPSSSTTYPRGQLLSALKEQHGAPVTLRCKGNVLNEVWFHYNLRGSLQDGQVVPAAPVGVRGNCPATVRYLPKEDDGNGGGGGGDGDGDRRGEAGEKRYVVA